MNLDGLGMRHERVSYPLRLHCIHGTNKKHQNARLAHCGTCHTLRCVHTTISTYISMNNLCCTAVVKISALWAGGGGGQLSGLNSSVQT